MAKPAFHEDIHCEHLSTLDGDRFFEDFHYDDIDRRLGWREPEETDEPERSEIDPQIVRELCLEIIGTRRDFREIGARWGRAVKAARQSPSETRSRVVLALTPFVCKVSKTKNQNMRSEGYMWGQRFVALAWLVNPSYFDGVSLTKLAAQFRLTAPCMSVCVSDAAKTLGITNRAIDRLAKERFKSIHEFREEIASEGVAVP